MRKNKHRLFVIRALAIMVFFAFHLLVGLVFGDTLATQPASYRFISLDIPTPGGQLGFTSLADINEEGEITGGFTNSNLGPRGYLLDDKFRLTDIQCPRTVKVEPNAEPQSINKRGEITGFCNTGRISGFFRNKKGKVTILDFPRSTLTEAVGINDDGQVVGDYRDSGGTFHGFFWDAGLFLTIDVPFPEARLTGPNGINNVGQIVGFYDDNSGGRHGFLFDRGIFISFDFPDSQLTAPTDINDHGQIVGVYVDSDGLLHGFLLENERFITIDVPFPAVFTEVSGINNRGQIVGRYLESNPDDAINPFLSHGFIATPESEPKSKSQVLVSKSNDFSNFKRWPQNVEELSSSLAKWSRQLH